MHFAHAIPWWLALLLAAAIGVAAYVEYRRPLSPLTPAQRGVLAGLRVLVLAALVLFLFRPIAILPPLGARDAIVPIVIDASRSMRLGDADGQTRIARAAALVTSTLLPSLSSRFRTETFTAGETLSPAPPDSVRAEQGRTDLVGAVA